MARPEELGPHIVRAYGILERNLLAFPQGMLGLLLPRVCIFGFVFGSFHFHFVTDVSLESENLDCDSFLSLRTVGVNRYGDAVESTRGPGLGKSANVQMFSPNGNLVPTICPTDLF